MRTDIVNGIPKDAERWLYEALHSLALNDQSSGRGFSAIIRGEMPDGSGTPLFNDGLYVKLLGRPGGQSIHGDTVAGGSMTLSSTNHGTKGFIYLGDALASAYDETNTFLGLGTATPSARLHLNLAAAGTSGNGTFGTHFMDATVAGSYIFSSSAYQNGAGVDWAFAIGGSNPGAGGTGSVMFVDNNRTVSLRLAMGTYGSDIINYLHMQYGILDSTPPFITVGNNVLFSGFNDNCGLYETHHFRHFNVWAEGDNLSGSAIGGRTVTATNMAIIGFNSPTIQRTGTTNYDDQPVVTIGGGSWYQSYHGVTLRITTGATFAGSGGTEGAQAKQEVFQIREGVSLNSGTSMLFAVDQFARLKMYNPGNGALTSSISARRSEFLLEDGTTGASTPSCHLEYISTNAWLDGGTAVVGYQQRIGYDDVQVAAALRNVIVCASSRVATAEAALLNRYAVRTSAFYVTDGTFTYNTGEVGAPLGMLNIFNFVDTTKVLLALKRMVGQTGDMMTMWDSNGSTALSGFTKDGAYYLVAGEGAGNWFRSDASGVGAWTAPGDLSNVDDTNVTLALTGTPTGALLKSVGLTLGWTGVLSVARGGTGSGTAVGAFDAISPLTTLGDTLYHNGTNNVRLGGNITTARQFLSQTGTGLVSAAPIWIGPLASTDLPATVAYINVANLFTTTQDITPLTDVAALTLHNPNGSGSTQDSLQSYDLGGRLVFAIRQTGRVQIGINDSATSAIVRLSLNCPSNQSVNIIQCQGGGLGTQTLFSVAASGAFVFGNTNFATPNVLLADYRTGIGATLAVADCTIAGDGVTVTTTTPNGFGTVAVQELVTGTGITPPTRVTSITDTVTIVLDTASTPGSGLTLTFTHRRSTNVLQVSTPTATIIRVQSNGNLLLGGSSTDATNNAFEKLTIQCSSSETSNLAQFTSGISGATAVVINNRAVMSTGRIKTAVLFTDDQSTVANSKLMGFSLTPITAGQTRTLSVSDGSGYILTDQNVVIDDAGMIVTHDGSVVVDLRS